MLVVGQLQKALLSTEISPYVFHVESQFPPEKIDDWNERDFLLYMGVEEEEVTLK